jgi:hypothetical protein
MSEDQPFLGDCQSPKVVQCPDCKARVFAEELPHEPKACARFKQAHEVRFGCPVCGLKYGTMGRCAECFADLKPVTPAAIASFEAAPPTVYDVYIRGKDRDSQWKHRGAAWTQESGMIMLKLYGQTTAVSPGEPIRLVLSEGPSGPHKECSTGGCAARVAPSERFCPVCEDERVGPEPTYPEPGDEEASYTTRIAEALEGIVERLQSLEQTVEFHSKEREDWLKAIADVIERKFSDTPDAWD